MPVDLSKYNENVQRFLLELRKSQGLPAVGGFEAQASQAPAQGGGLSDAVIKAAIAKKLMGSGAAELAPVGATAAEGAASSGSMMLPSLQPMMPSSTAAAPGTSLAGFAPALAPLAIAGAGYYLTRKADHPDRQYKRDEILASLRADSSAGYKRPDGKSIVNHFANIPGWDKADDSRRGAILDKAKEIGLLGLPGFADNAGNTIDRRPEYLMLHKLNPKAMNPADRARMSWNQRHESAVDGPLPTVSDVENNILLKDSAKARFIDFLKTINPDANKK